MERLRGFLTFFSYANFDKRSYGQLFSLLLMRSDYDFVLAFILFSLDFVSRYKLHLQKHQLKGFLFEFNLGAVLICLR